LSGKGLSCGQWAVHPQEGEGGRKRWTRQEIPDTPSYRSASWQDNRDIKIISKLKMSFQGYIILLVVPEEAQWEGYIATYVDVKNKP